MLAGSNTTTATAHMTTESIYSHASATSTFDELSDINTESSSSVERQFDESKCLFCDQTSTDLDQNMTHMSKNHGFRIDLTDLLVDVMSLLSYIHLLVSEFHECIYCGTQRHTRQAVQQHMMAKSHCRYDLTDEQSELQDFFQRPSIRSENEQRIKLAQRLNESQFFAVRLRRARSMKHTDISDSGSVISPAKQASTTRTYPNGSGSGSDSDYLASHITTALSTRALKQAQTLDNQLSQLRAGDRKSLAHLPVSQQRALLATHHKQMEQGRRSEQIYRGNLDSAGNKFGRLSTIRLIRKPPHTGNIHSLNR